MGRAQKLKLQRKQEELEKKIHKEKKKEKFFSILLYSFIGLLVFVAGFWGAKQIFGNKSPSYKTYKVSERNYSKAPDMQIDVNKKYFAYFETSLGNFKAELFSKEAPKTVNNFVVLSSDKFYDSLTFHRIIKDFMIQGGDPKGDGTSGPGYQFEDEVKDNPYKLERGILAMANSGPNTNGSQFFIITKDKTPWLDGKHTPFGKIIDGLDVVLKISQVKTDEQAKPQEAVTIKNISIKNE